MTTRSLALLLVLASPLAAEEAPKCPVDTKPVVSLGFGSRYTDDSENRSDFDEESDKAVTAALRPIDDFITDLAKQTNILNDPKTKPEEAQTAAACVLDSILAWARADALSDLRTQGAKLSAPSRVGGIAFAYAAALKIVPQPQGQAEIEAWFLARSQQTMAFFDTEAPPRASQNNLRAWAGLAVTRVGMTQGDPTLIDWGAETLRLVACTADADGSLPNEMWRGKLALHYQLHAVAPLVTTAALLQDERPELFTACDRALPRIVRFTLDGLDDPSTVEKITGEKQSVGGTRKARDFELAWVPAYLTLDPDAKIAARLDKIKELGNSKLGGDQRLLWPGAAPAGPADG
ncbi:alginate lyase family protein [Tabrizicola sp.]|uniref:alginate lyase family protein n=1 Tax=Tabrizicola sp. TaxID=2005166 RepID=UPI002735F7C5|nr:alginate lyase family protein [Tabrizicola sp.]MDP3193901.1 alginate lyase family protein [Tabrizicola sp.]